MKSCLVRAKKGHESHFLAALLAHFLEKTFVFIDLKNSRWWPFECTEVGQMEPFAAFQPGHGRQVRGGGDQELR